MTKSRKKNRPLSIKFFSQLIFVTIKDLRGMCICFENNFCDRKIILKWYNVKQGKIQKNKIGGSKMGLFDWFGGGKKNS